jgi:hypothetical protein
MRKKHVFVRLLLVAGLSICFAACEKDPGPAIAQAKFKVVFRVLYDGQALEKYKNYPYGTRTLSFDRFSTYISDLTLLKGTEKVKLSDIEVLNFTPDLAPDNKAVSVVFEYEAPAGTYSGLQIGYGVRADLNAKTPAAFPPNHPLYLENEYWSGWDSYLFTRLAGRVDLSGDGVPETNLFYDTGSDAMYTTAQINKTVDVSASGTIAVEIDLKNLFVLNGQLLDLNLPANRETSHDPSDIKTGKMIMDNLTKATALKQ